MIRHKHLRGEDKVKSNYKTRGKEGQSGGLSEIMGCFPFRLMLCKHNTHQQQGVCKSISWETGEEILKETVMSPSYGSVVRTADEAFEKGRQ